MRKKAVREPKRAKDLHPVLQPSLRSALDPAPHSPLLPSLRSDLPIALPLTLLLTLLIILLLTTTACSGTSQDTTSDDGDISPATPRETPASKTVFVGTSTEKSSQLTIINRTGKSLSDLELETILKSTNTATGSSKMTADNLMANDGDTLVISIDPDYFSSEQRIKTNIIFRDLYNITLTFTDGSSSKIYGLGAEDIVEYSLLFSPDGVLYLSYSTADGMTHNTLEGERARRAATNSKQSGDARDEAAQDYTYNYDSTGSGSAKQTGDACVD